MLAIFQVLSPNWILQCVCRFLKPLPELLRLDLGVRALYPTTR